LAPWICFVRAHGDDTLSRDAVQDFSERLQWSADPIVQQLCAVDSRSPHEHIDLANTEPVLANAAGQALTTIVKGGPLGQAAEDELLSLLLAHLAKHPVRHTPSQPLPSSVFELLSPQGPAEMYVEPTDKRALAFQILALLIVVGLSAAMTFLLRM
jgi:hypothetical protein